jgi:hypothetical protein
MSMSMMAKVASFWNPALNEPTLSLSKQAIFVCCSLFVVRCFPSTSSG